MTNRDRFKISNAALQQICDVYQLGKIESVDWAGRGMNNPVFIVNNRHVLRFDGLDHNGRSRFFGEQLAYEQLRANGIPAPDVLAVDVSKAIVPHDFIILSKIEGRPLIDDWKSLSSTQQEQAAREAGHYLAMMHEITLPGFGQLSKPEAERFPSWYAYVMEYMGRYGQEAVEAGILSAAQKDAMLAAFERHEAMLHVAGRLVHWDYHFENILQQDGKITGIIDFEWALVGDPVYDFKQHEQWEETCPGSRDWLYKGYKELRSLPDDFEERSALYRIMMYLDWAVDAVNDEQRTEAKALLIESITAVGG